MSDDLTQLREEADSMSPAFSESLHTETMSRVNRARRERMSGEAGFASSNSSSGLPWLRFTAVAAALLLAVGIWQMMPDHSADTPMQLSALMETIQESTFPIQEQFSRPFSQADGQLTLLQDDAKTFGQFIADQFDVLPIREEKSL